MASVDLRTLERAEHSCPVLWRSVAQIAGALEVDADRLLLRPEHNSSDAFTSRDDHDKRFAFDERRFDDAHQFHLRRNIDLQLTEVAGNGERRLVLVVGDSGVGKTTALRQIARNHDLHWTDCLTDFERPPTNRIFVADALFDSHPMLEEGWLLQATKRTVVFASTSDRDIAEKLSRQIDNIERIDIDSFSRSEVEQFVTGFQHVKPDELYRVTQGNGCYLQIARRLAESQVTFESEGLATSDARQALLNCWLRSVAPPYAKQICEFLSSVPCVGTSPKAIAHCLGVTANELSEALHELYALGIVRLLRGGYKNVGAILRIHESHKASVPPREDWLLRYIDLLRPYFSKNARIAGEDSLGILDQWMVGWRWIYDLPPAKRQEIGCTLVDLLRCLENLLPSRSSRLVRSVDDYLRSFLPNQEIHLLPVAQVAVTMNDRLRKRRDERLVKRPSKKLLDFLWWGAVNSDDEWVRAKTLSALGDIGRKSESDLVRRQIARKMRLWIRSSKPTECGLDLAAAIGFEIRSVGLRQGIKILDDQPERNCNLADLVVAVAKWNSNDDRGFLEVIERAKLSPSDSVRRTSENLEFLLRRPMPLATLEGEAGFEFLMAQFAGSLVAQATICCWSSSLMAA